MGKKDRKRKVRKWSSAKIAKMRQQGKLKDGPIRREALTPAATGRAKQVYARVGHMIVPTFEQWELGFLRELTPELEIAVWEVIADAFDAYKAEKPDVDMDTLRMLIAISTGGGPKHETAESRRLRELFRQYEERHPNLASLRGDKDVKVMVVGVADCHGLESCDLKVECLGPLYYELRAASNQQRHAVAYLAEIQLKHVETIDALLDAGKNADALAVFRDYAGEIRLADNTGAGESWGKIPDSSLDPWTQETVTASIRETLEIKMPCLMKTSDGEIIPVDGFRRHQAFKELNLGGDDSVHAYVVDSDGSEDHWQKFNISVKRAESPNSKEGTSD